MQAVCAEVAPHLPPGTHGFKRDIGGGVQPVEKILGGQQPQGHHEGLVAVIPASEIPVAKGPGHGQLGEFLPVAEDPEFRLAGQNFAAPEQAAFPADECDPVILQDLIPEIAEGDVFFRIEMDFHR